MEEKQTFVKVKEDNVDFFLFLLSLAHETFSRSIARRTHG
jgi:hypothetical protein